MLVVSITKKRTKLMSQEVAHQRAITQKHRDDNSLENLWLDLLQFLSQALQDVRVNRATEQVKASHATKQAKATHATKQTKTSHATEHAKPLENVIEECNNMVESVIMQWCDRHDQQSLYDEEALLKHKQMFDIMQWNKEAIPNLTIFVFGAKNSTACGRKRPALLQSMMNSQGVQQRVGLKHWLSICLPTICCLSRGKIRST